MRYSPETATSSRSALLVSPNGASQPSQSRCAAPVPSTHSLGQTPSPPAVIHPIPDADSDGVPPDRPGSGGTRHMAPLSTQLDKQDPHHVLFTTRPSYAPTTGSVSESKCERLPGTSEGALKLLNIYPVTGDCIRAAKESL